MGSEQSTVWVADDHDAERIQGGKGATPEEAALEYLTGYCDPADGKTECLAHRKPTVEEQLEFHLANVDVDEILENLSMRAEDEGGEVFEGWLDIDDRDAKEKLGWAIAAAVREYLVETGSVGSGNPWIPAESVEMELVDGEVRRVPTAEAGEVPDA